MTLTAGRGPLSVEPAGWFTPPIPAAVTFTEPHPRRIRAVRAGQTVIDTERALMVHRQGRPLGYAFPESEVGDLPREPEPTAPGYVLVPWEAVDTWYEEGRRLVHYPPNPYHRVDCHPTRRRLRVDIAGATLVDTLDTVIVFETSLEPRLYVDPALVRTDLLRRIPVRPDAGQYVQRAGHDATSSATAIAGTPSMRMVRCALAACTSPCSSRSRRSAQSCIIRRRGSTYLAWL